MALFRCNTHAIYKLENKFYLNIFFLFTFLYTHTESSTSILESFVVI